MGGEGGAEMMAKCVIERADRARRFHCYCASLMSCLRLQGSRVPRKTSKR